MSAAFVAGREFGFFWNCLAMKCRERPDADLWFRVGRVVLPGNPIAGSAWSSRSRSRRLKRLSARERWPELLDDCGTEVVNAVERERGVHRGRRSVEGSHAAGAWWSVAVASGRAPDVPVVKPTDLGELDHLAHRRRLHVAVFGGVAVERHVATGPVVVDQVRLQDAPAGRTVEGRPSASAKVVALPRCGGLHHRYVWREAA